MGFVVHCPDPVDATLIKVTNTLEPTRLFGIANYDVLEIVPVAVKSDYDNKEFLKREDVLWMAPMNDLKAKGFQGVQDKVKKLEACAMCHKKRDTPKVAYRGL